MTARQMRITCCSFLALSLAIAGNIFFLQDETAAITAAKAKARRVAAKAELRRVRALSVDAPDRVGRRAKAKRPVVRKTAAHRRAGQTLPLRGRLVQSAAKASGSARKPGETVQAIQRELKRRGYRPGMADGVPGLVTRAAIMAFEHDRGVLLTGEPSSDLLRMIVLGPGRQGAGRRAERQTATRAHAERIIRTVQQSLKTLGYHPGKADGIAGDDTSRAIREFEMDQGLTPKGRISGHLVARLAWLARRGKAG